MHRGGLREGRRDNGSSRQCVSLVGSLLSQMRDESARGVAAQTAFADVSQIAGGFGKGVEMMASLRAFHTDSSVTQP